MEHRTDIRVTNDDSFMNIHIEKIVEGKGTLISNMLKIKSVKSSQAGKIVKLINEVMAEVMTHVDTEDL